jgi:hypothetical protein
MHLLDGVKWNEAKRKLWEINAEDMSCIRLEYTCVGAGRSYSYIGGIVQSIGVGLFSYYSFALIL